MTRVSNKSLRTNVKQFLIFLFLVAPLAVNAAIIPCGPGDNGANANNISGCSIGDLFQLLVNIYNFLLGLAALVAILILVWGGIQMFTYHYQESPDDYLNRAKLTVTRGIFGLVIIAAAYVITNTLLTLLGLNRGSAVGQLLQSFGL